MNFGRIKLGGGSNEDRYVNNTAQLESDISRLLLLVAIFAAVIIGSIYSNRADKPVPMVQHAVKMALGDSFKASIEGNVSMNNVSLGEFRLRQQYSPDTGLKTVEAISPDLPPFDAVTALELIRRTTRAIEHSRQDMYHYGTRHFSGSVKIPGNESTAIAFQCWLELSEHFLVRLELSKVDRNAGINEKGEPVSKETYINIHYYDYGK